MSFILDALKKSEQQRQQKHQSPQQVRKRTLATPSRKQGRSPFWIVAVVLSLVLLCSWWFYDHTEPALEKALAVSPTTEAPVSHSQPAAVEFATGPVSVASVPEPRVAVVEPVPVNTTSVEKNASAAKSKQIEVSTSESVLTSDEQVATVVVEQPKPRVSDQPPLKASPVELPLYLGLSRELRDQMPRLAMSMHYYIAAPDRRMVRINNLLLHEGDWVSDDLQIIEITSTGVTLDFLGKLFEMRSAGR